MTIEGEVSRFRLIDEIIDVVTQFKLFGFYIDFKAEIPRVSAGTFDITDDLRSGSGIVQKFSSLCFRGLFWGSLPFLSPVK